MRRAAPATRAGHLLGDFFQQTSIITLTDGGHLWPDPNDNVGLDANYAVIEFFKRH